MSETNRKQAGAVGIDAQAYAQREKGYSPDDIRNAVWKIAGESASGRVLDVGSGDGGWIKRLKTNNAIEHIMSLDIVDAGARRIAAECMLDATDVLYGHQGRIMLTPYHYPSPLSKLFPRALSDNLFLIGRKP